MKTITDLMSSLHSASVEAVSISAEETKRVIPDANPPLAGEKRARLALSVEDGLMLADKYIASKVVPSKKKQKQITKEGLWGDRATAHLRNHSLLIGLGYFHGNDQIASFRADFEAVSSDRAGVGTLPKLGHINIEFGQLPGKAVEPQMIYLQETLPAAQADVAAVPYDLEESERLLLRMTYEALGNPSCAAVLLNGAPQRGVKMTNDLLGLLIEEKSVNPSQSSFYLLQSYAKAHVAIALCVNALKEIRNPGEDDYTENKRIAYLAAILFTYLEVPRLLLNGKQKTRWLDVDIQDKLNALVEQVRVSQEKGRYFDPIKALAGRMAEVLLTCQSGVDEHGHPINSLSISGRTSHVDFDILRSLSLENVERNYNSVQKVFYRKSNLVPVMSAPQSGACSTAAFFPPSPASEGETSGVDHRLELTVTA